VGSRVKFACTCGQHLVAPEGMIGRKVRCPSCVRPVIVPANGAVVDEAEYVKTPRYALVCTCKYRLLVKAAAAEQEIYCPMCRTKFRVPSLDVLRQGTAYVVQLRPGERQKVGTDEMVIMADDEDGPGTEVK